ncbi:hypothetical protein GS682_04650 [Nostoc sp. B(2019)]|nr:hypothetical protein [Nostoc sp. B(2019)]
MCWFLRSTKLASLRLNIFAPKDIDKLRITEDLSEAIAVQSVQEKA